MGHSSLVQRVRQHHALEHATLTLLSRIVPGAQAAARSDLQGFIVYGNVDTNTLQQCAEEALVRLRSGERRLAIHANCGTNLVTAGTLSGLAAALLAATGTRRTWWERVPSAVLGATAALMFAGPAGHWAQEHLTTSPFVDGLRIVSVKRMEGPVLRHRVRITP